VLRLSLYLRQLEHLAAEGREKVSSTQLAKSLHATDAQVRKDLGYFGQFGRRGVGYPVAPLIEVLRHILGTDRVSNVVVVGAGDLGRALMRYRGFARKGFRFVAAFDVAPGKIGRKVGDVPVLPIGQLEDIVRRHRVKLAVVAVPVDAAQQVTDRLCRAGVGGILNFAPTTLHTASGVAVGTVDLAGHLEQLSFRAASGKQ
jgi:redox-sensing transcriptional repressor